MFRRDEILGLFADYVYVRVDNWCPQKLDFEILNEVNNYQDKNILYKEIKLYYNDFNFTIKFFAPYSDKPVPTFVYIMHEYEIERCDFDKELNCEYVPIEDITSCGYAVAESIYLDFDHNAHYTGSTGCFTV